MYLYEKLDAIIPPEVIRHLQSFKAPKHEQVVYRLITHPRGILGFLPLHLYSYLGTNKDQNMLPRLIGLGEYLKHMWGRKHMWQLPISIAIKGVKLIWNAVKGLARVYF